VSGSGFESIAGRPYDCLIRKTGRPCERRRTWKHLEQCKPESTPDDILNKRGRKSTNNGIILSRNLSQREGQVVIPEGFRQRPSPQKGQTLLNFLGRLYG
jgi:hypothetical protein